nr:unnamed protein product [Digitaria exilis]CAB3504070.1 unnamed protein product [Digitaria exilis]
MVGNTQSTCRHSLSSTSPTSFFSLLILAAPGGKAAGVDAGAGTGADAGAKPGPGAGAGDPVSSSCSSDTLASGTWPLASCFPVAASAIVDAALRCPGGAAVEDDDVLEEVAHKMT